MRSIKSKAVFWHRELPPFRSKPLDEHVVEATSIHIANTVVDRDELWRQCYEDLMANARKRIEQEIIRLGGSYAHVLDESVESRSNDVTQEVWLHGLYRYMLYADGEASSNASSSIQTESGA